VNFIEHLWLFRIFMARELGVSVRREPVLLVQIPGSQSLRSDLAFVDWDNGRDLYVDVVGTTPQGRSYRSSFVPRGAVGRVGALKAASCQGSLLEYSCGPLHVIPSGAFPWTPTICLSACRGTDAQEGIECPMVGLRRQMGRSRAWLL
jgi:hypothetical protein